MALSRSDRSAARREQRAERLSGRPQPARTPVGGAPEPPRRSHFLAESWGELKKVEWPGQNQVIQGTVVVLVACAVVGVFLYVNDAIWKQVVQKVFLGQ
jgi:preprotein translocase SecE subunit